MLLAVTNPWPEIRPVQLTIQVEPAAAARSATLSRSGEPDRELSFDVDGHSNTIPVHLKSGDNRDNFFKLTVDSGTAAKSPRFSVFWQTDLDWKPTLHFVTVGVSKYKTYSSLHYADRDAQTISTALRNPNSSLLFSRTNGIELVNEEATRDNVLNVLKKLGEDASVQPMDLVIVAISGHGLSDKAHSYFFLPHDYDRSKPASRVTAADILNELKTLPCQVVLILDTCHAGAASDGIKGDGPDADTVRATAEIALRKAAQTALQNFRSNEKGLVILAACSRNEEARESTAFHKGHGAFTCALLEGLGHYNTAVTADKSESTKQTRVQLITLETLYDYAKQRLDKRQQIILHKPDHLDLSRIPLRLVETTSRKDAP